MLRAYPATAIEGRIRAEPADFFVDEILGFEPEGEGEFFLIQIEKVGANTSWVCGELAKELGLPRRAISHSGLKDRHAVTRQWLSVHYLKKGTPNWDALANDAFRVLGAQRHRRKLRPGSHRKNRFAIRLRELIDADDLLLHRCAEIRSNGAPNYFGPQRFGREGQNVVKAQAAIVDGRRMRGRQERSLMISAARAHLFNAWLEQRVMSGQWQRVLRGDYLMLDGRRSFFGPVDADDAESHRFGAFDLHVAGPLAGRERASTLWSPNEDGFRAEYAEWVAGLERVGADLDRRASRIAVPDLAVAREGDTATLAFTLPRGSYATSLLNEIGVFTDNKLKVQNLPRPLVA